MNGLKIIKRYVANVLILAVIVTLVAVGFSVKSTTASVSEQPVYKGNSVEKVALMFNVYWGTEYIDGILETLKRHNATTTFFVGGSWARDNEAMLLKIIDHGHEIGNHGFFHKDHKKLSYEMNMQEISATHSLVKAVSGVEMKLFAPPSGAFSQNTITAANELGYLTVMWSKDTIDWRDRDSAKIFNRATKGIEGGDLILMHPTAETSAALDAIINRIKECGLSIAPVSAVIPLEE